MASSSSQYAYQKPSTIATRSIVTGTKPTQTASSSSHDAETAQDRPTLQRKTTDHYQQAVQEAASSKVDAADEPTASSTSKPALGRQQSWNQADLKRGAMERILGDQSIGHGYTSTGSRT